MRTRTLLLLLALMLFILPFAAQPVQVGGDFGRSWLNSYGSKTAAEELSSGLWTWGAVPKGQVLVNGTHSWFVAQMTGHPVMFRTMP